jgi:hypothetical protein
MTTTFVCNVFDRIGLYFGIDSCTSPCWSIVSNKKMVEHRLYVRIHAESRGIERQDRYRDSSREEWRNVTKGNQYCIT